MVEGLTSQMCTENIFSVIKNTNQKPSLGGPITGKSYSLAFKYEDCYNPFPTCTVTTPPLPVPQSQNNSIAFPW